MSGFARTVSSSRRSLSRRRAYDADGPYDAVKPYRNAPRRPPRTQFSKGAGAAAISRTVRTPQRAAVFPSSRSAQLPVAAATGL